jgi:hypothetical protein
MVGKNFDKKESNMNILLDKQGQIDFSKTLTSRESFR